MQKQVKPEVRRKKKTPTKDQHLQQELGCPCESPLGCVGCGAPVKGVAGVGLFVCLIVCLFVVMRRALLPSWIPILSLCVLLVM